MDRKDFAEDALDAKIQFHSFFHSNRNNWSMFLDLFKGGSRTPRFCSGGTLHDFLGAIIEIGREIP